jgi:hypothetical protein
VKSVEKSGNDLIVTLDAAGNGIATDEFAPKLIGKTTSGSLLYGYARLPYIDYIKPIVFTAEPHFAVRPQSVDVTVEVTNFGQVTSQKTTLKLTVVKDENTVEVGKTSVPALKAYEKTNGPVLRHIVV